MKLSCAYCSISVSAKGMISVAFLFCRISASCLGTSVVMGLFGDHLVKSNESLLTFYFLIIGSQ